MRYATSIVFLLFCQHAFGQVKFGTYSQLDTTVYADLQLYSNKKFDFYDTRAASCWIWTRTIGKWTLNKDTIAFTWQSSSTERYDSIISNWDPKKRNYEFTFVYDDEVPIPKAEISLSCLFESNPQKYHTDKNGKVIIPEKESVAPDTKMCGRSGRMLYFDIKGVLSANTSLDYYSDSLDNIFKIVIKRNPRTTYQTVIKKYLVEGNTLKDIDPKEFYNYNWGNFKFVTKKYGK